MRTLARELTLGIDNSQFFTVPIDSTDAASQGIQRNGWTAWFKHPKFDFVYSYRSLLTFLRKIFEYVLLMSELMDHLISWDAWVINSLKGWLTLKVAERRMQDSLAGDPHPMMTTYIILQNVLMLNGLSGRLIRHPMYSTVRRETCMSIVNA